MATEHTEDIGTVTSVQGRNITVEICKSGGCKTCSMHGICGSNNTPIILHFETGDDYKIGDQVIVSVSSGVRILSSLIVFILPLIALLGFFLLGRNFTSELGAIIIGFTGMLAAFIAIRLIDRKIAKHINFQLEGKYEN